MQLLLWLLLYAKWFHYRVGFVQLKLLQLQSGLQSDNARLILHYYECSRNI